jgi:L-ribulose-5-phosphate 4-epimerase
MRRRELRRRVFEANLDLVRHGLVTLTWGNASEVDREEAVMAIKPSGVSYDEMTDDDIVVVSLDGTVVEGSRRPSSDTLTHLVLYRDLPDAGGVVHTHSTFATAFAQARREIPLFGTTHADFAPDAVPVSRALRADEIEGDYEENTGHVLTETIAGRGIDVVPAVLVANHGPFVVGHDAADALERAVTLEQVAKMAWLTLGLDPRAQPVGETLRAKHFSRKHGPDAYYGQPTLER